jgi:hypothetical protein
MPEVSLYVAAITAAAGVSGAAIPAVAVLIRDVRQAERDRRERHAEAKRQACLDLLRAGSELRTRVANAAQYHGTEMSALLAQIRECDAAVQLHAVGVALLASGKLAGPADDLAAETSRLSAAAADNADPDAGVMAIEPDPAELNDSITAFRKMAVADAGQKSTDGR